MAIHTSRKSGFIRRGGVMRRESFWFSITVLEATLAAADTAGVLGSLNQAALDLRPFTIVRSRGFVSIRSDQVAASESQSAMFGQAVVSEQAAAIGVTAVPTPSTDGDSDLWMVFETLTSRFELLSSVGFDQQSLVSLPIDSKAMRKVEGGQDVVIVAETSTVSTGAVVQMAVRQLIKLH